MGSIINGSLILGGLEGNLQRLETVFLVGKTIHRLNGE